MPECENCGKSFPKTVKENGRIWDLTSRRFCPKCSPLGGNNRRTYVVIPEPGQAFCARCQKIKDRGEFHNRKGGTPLSYCKICQEVVKALKLEEKMEKAVALKGGACIDCGNTFPVPVFEFLKDGKTLPLSVVKNMSWERFSELLGQYEMLCHNCSSLRKWESGD